MFLFNLIFIVFFHDMHGMDNMENYSSTSFSSEIRQLILVNRKIRIICLPYFILLILIIYLYQNKIENLPVFIATILRVRRLRNRGSIHGTRKTFLHRIQTNCEAHPIYIWSPFPTEKAAMAWSWQISSIYWRGKNALIYVWLSSRIRLHGAVRN